MKKTPAQNRHNNIFFTQVVILTAVFFLSFFVTYTTLKWSRIHVGTPKDESTSTYSSKIYSPEKESDTTLSVLLIGYGGAGHDGGTLADTLMLLQVDYETKKGALISIPRDTWVSLPLRSDYSENFKINMSHAIGLDDKTYPYKQPEYQGEAGGGELAKHAVSIVTGIKPLHFVSVDFEGFQKTIDSLGGINVEIPVSFTDSYYPVKGLENETCGFTAAEIELFHRMYTGFELEKQFECRYEELVFTKGKMKMDGETALKFVRSRHSDTHGGDFARSERQQAVLTALKNKLITLGAIDNYPEFVDLLSNSLRTDLDLEELSSLIDLVGNPDEYDIRLVNLSTENVLIHATSSSGAYILIPQEGIGNWERVHTFIKESLNEE